MCLATEHRRTVPDVEFSTAISRQNLAFFMHRRGCSILP